MKVRHKDYGKSGIYVIINTFNSKKYIGKSVNIGNRIGGHLSTLKSKSKDENRHLINAWYKYGEKVFTYFVIEYIEDINKLGERELYWMEYFGTLDRRFGYNLRKDSSSQCIVSDETKALLSKSGRENYQNNPERKLKVSENTKKFWQENPKIKKQMGRNVSKVKTNYKIRQYTKDFQLIEEFETQLQLRKAKPDYYLPAILNVCNGNKSSYKGFYWRYFDIKANKEVEVSPTYGMREIEVICNTTGKVYNFKTAVEISKELNIALVSVYNMLSGKTVKKHNYTMKWI